MMNLLKLSIRPITLTLLVVIHCLLPQNRLVANPSSKNPRRPLATHGTVPEAKGLATSMYQLYDKEESNVIKMFDRRDNPASYSDKVISNAAAAFWQAKRDANRLTLMGEPVGADLMRKFSLLNHQNNRFAGAYGSTAPGSKRRAQIIQQLNRERQKVSKQLDKLSQQVQRGQLEGAEKQLESLGQDLMGKVVYFSPSVKNKYISKFIGVMGACDAKLIPKRKAAYQQLGRTAIAKQLENVRSFRSQAARVIGRIGRTPEDSTGDVATPGGESTAGGTPGEADDPAPKITAPKTAVPEGEQPLSAAQALTQIADLWGKASASLLRAHAIQWAFTNRPDSATQPSAAELMEQATNALIAVIDTASLSTPPEKVASVYSDLLKQLSVVDRRRGGAVISGACEVALARLAAKNPGLPSVITAYTQATTQPLRWRMKFTEQQVRAMREGIPTAGVLMSRKTEPTKHIRPNFVPFRPRKTWVAAPSFNAAANWMVFESAALLLNQQVVEEKIFRLTPSSRTSVVPYTASHYSNLPVSMSYDKKLSDLQAALFVDETHGPLSMAAADAISSAELHDFLAVGGDIKVIHLESTVTRFIALPDVAYTLSRLGRIPKLGDPDRTSPLSLTCWRLDISPRWAQHKYFTVKK